MRRIINWKSGGFFVIAYQLMFYLCVDSKMLIIKFFDEKYSPLKQKQSVSMVR